MAAILNFGGHFGSYINYYKSETFLMPNKSFVDIFIGLLQEIVLCRCLNRFFQSNRGHHGSTLKRKIRDGNIPGITEHI